MVAVDDKRARDAVEAGMRRVEEAVKEIKVVRDWLVARRCRVGIPSHALKRASVHKPSRLDDRHLAILLQYQLLICEIVCHAV